MKRLPVYSLVCTLISLTFFMNTSTAQIVGGGSYSAPSPKEVKAGTLSNELFTENVSLSNGSFSMGQTLGSVSTPGGLSFSVQIGYSSTISTGSVVPSSKGIPYGDGWDLSLPSVSASNLFYKKYPNDTIKRTNRADFTNDGYRPLCFDGQEAYEEGASNLYAVQVSIPGVINERFVLKYFESVSGVCVFIPAFFDKYVEARYYGFGKWIVSLNDGTQYLFDVTQFNTRAPSNQRIGMDGNGNNITSSAALMHEYIEPKLDIVNSYCSMISNPNLPDNQRILFKYEKFGEFNFFKETSLITGIDYTVAKDVFLKEVSACSGDLTLEKVVLDYSSIVDASCTGNGLIGSEEMRNGFTTRKINKSLLDNIFVIGEPGVFRYDSLYNYKDIYSQGAGGITSFTDWKRFHHGKNPAFASSNDVDQFNISPLNPYKVSGGLNSNLMDEYYLMTGAVGTPSIAFDHCYLESGNVPKSVLHPGDMYEIKTEILFPTDQATHEPLFDISIVGKKDDASLYQEVIGTGISGFSTVKSSSYECKQSIFSTFGNASKWSPLFGNYNSAGIFSTSNFFSLSNILGDHEGIQIQIGPANSDNLFSAMPENSNTATWQDLLNCAGSNSGVEIFSSIFTYFDHVLPTCTISQPDWTDDAASPYKLNKGARTPSNFGIGLPWYMMREVYFSRLKQNYYGLNMNTEQLTIDQSPIYKFWWNTPITPCSNPNNPTGLNEFVKLQKVALRRYTKNPYMLTKVTTYKTYFDSNKAMINSKPVRCLQFDYDVVNHDIVPQTTNSSSYVPENTVTSFVLTKIISVPLNLINTSNSATSLQWPAITMEYFAFEPTQAWLEDNFELKDHNYSGAFNSSGEHIGGSFPVLINKIVDNLGKITLVDYNEDLILIPTQFDDPYKHTKVDEWDIPNCGAIPNTKNLPIAFQLIATVKSREEVTAGSVPRKWDYEYSAIVSKADLKQNISFSMPVNFERSIGWTQSVCPVVRVFEPKLNNSDINRAYTRYENYADMVLFGKLKSVKSYNVNQDLVSESTNEYSISLAYEFPKYHALKLNNEALENINLQMVSLEECPSFYTQLRSDRFLEVKYRSYFPQDYLNSYFVGLKKEIKRKYDPILSESNVFPYSAGNTTGINYANSNQNVVTVLANVLSYEQPLLPKDVYIENVTEYDYYDAKYAVSNGSFIGKSLSKGFERLIPGFVPNSTTLYTEPSFELCSKKSYSPQLPDQYVQEEFYYFYDLANYFGTNLKDAIAIEGLKYSMAYGIKNIPYAKRLITKGTDPTPSYKLETYHYKDNWDEPILGHFADSIVNVNACWQPPVVVITGIEWPWAPFEPVDDPCAYRLGGHMFLGEEGPIEQPVNDTVVDRRQPCPETGRYTNIVLNTKPYVITGNNLRPSGYFYSDYCYSGSAPVGFDMEATYGSLNHLMLEETRLIADQTLSANYTQLPTTAKTPDAITRFVIPVTNSGNINLNNKPYLEVLPYEMVRREKILERNKWGTPQLVADASDLKTRYKYALQRGIRYLDNCGNQIRHIYFDNLSIVQPYKAIVGDGLPDALETTYEYNPDYTVKNIIDPNGLVIHYTYDNFQRLKETFEDGKLISRNNYNFWDRNDADTYHQRAAENYIETITWKEDNSTAGLISRSYLDPLGRNYNSANCLSPDAGNGITDNIMVHSGLIEYDSWNRLLRQYHPFSLEDNSSIPFVPRFSATNSLHYKSNREGFTEKQYEADARNRVIREAKPLENINIGHTVNSEYGIVSGVRLSYELALNEFLNDQLLPGDDDDYNFEKNSVTDEDNHKTTTYTNALGQKVASVQFIDGTTNAVTLFLYDVSGNLTKVINPEMQETDYIYNVLGRLWKKHTVDGGSNYYVYDKMGNLVLEVDQNGLSDDGSSDAIGRYYKYDKFHRKLQQSKVYVDKSDILQIKHSNNWLWSGGISAFEMGITEFKREKEWHYGEAINALSNSYHSKVRNYLLLSRSSMKGKLSHTVSYNADALPIQFTFYSYYLDGNLKWEAQQFNPNGIEPSARGTCARIDYRSYNYNNKCKEEDVDINSDGKLDLQYYYDYDARGQLQNVYANFDDTKNTSSANKIANYITDEAFNLLTSVDYYTKNNSLADVSCDRILHTYDNRLRLTNLKSKFLDWRMYYDGNGFQSIQGGSGYITGENFNGNINSTLAHYTLGLVNNKPSSFDDGTYYTYTYDQLNRLVNADRWIAAPGQSYQDNGITSAGDEVYTYDRIGNIMSMNRTDASMANMILPYYYEGGSNRLSTTTVGNYIYDANGNLHSDSYRSLDEIEYVRANLPSQITTNAGTLHQNYLFDINDMRISKITSEPGGFNVSNSEYYLRDAMGHEIGVVNYTSGRWNYYVYGAQRIAELYPDVRQFPENLTKDFADVTRIDSTQEEAAMLLTELRRVKDLDIPYPYSIYQILRPDSSIIYIETSTWDDSLVIDPELDSTHVIITQITFNNADALLPMAENATGRRIYAKVNEIINGTEYPNVDDNNILTIFDPFNHPYTIMSDPAFNPHSVQFYIYDHLGNTRVTYTPKYLYTQSDPTKDIFEYNLKGVFDYFPYGKIYREYIDGQQEKYLTTQHERDVETGLDYRGARFYDSDLGRFLSLDPLAEKYAGWSSYNYVLGNPVLLIDPDGRKPDKPRSKKFTLVLTAGIQFSFKFKLLGWNVGIELNSGSIDVVGVRDNKISLFGGPRRGASASIGPVGVKKEQEFQNKPIDESTTERTTITSTSLEATTGSKTKEVTEKQVLNENNGELSKPEVVSEKIIDEKGIGIKIGTGFAIEFKFTEQSETEIKN